MFDALQTRKGKLLLRLISVLESSKWNDCSEGECLACLDTPSSSSGTTKFFVYTYHPSQVEQRNLSDVCKKTWLKSMVQKGKGKEEREGKKRGEGEDGKGKKT